jgi:catechol 2,3-dioxygenase-like lactoylglutathione lyase family enzyme
MHTTSPMVRTALFVADLERSTRFYQDVLGLAEIWYEGDLSSGNANELLGMPAGSYTKARILKADGPEWGMVGIFEVSNPTPPDLSRDASQINQGETCLVFYHANLDDVTAKLNAGDHHILCAPLLLNMEGKGRQREMTFRDPDGVLINLIESDPDDSVRREQK